MPRGWSCRTLCGTLKTLTCVGPMSNMRLREDLPCPTGSGQGASGGAFEARKMFDRGSRLALLTDLYELTMAAAYWENGFDTTATFELLIRRQPSSRGFLLFAGLEQVLDYLENVHFTADDTDYLRRHPVFSRVRDAFFDYLREFRFSGEVWAVPEGTPVFAGEPLIRVTAPIIEAQLVETFLLTTTTFQTTVATKAARVVEAAQGRGVVEFGSRRAHGPHAGVLAARAAYIGGCMGTSNVEAGYLFGIPTYGTVAHSFVMACADETESFRRFARVFPDHAVLLLDTYDTLAAVDKLVRLGIRPAGIRLDSGDLVALSREVRRRLDRAGLNETKIFASGDLNEFLISDMLSKGAPIDQFGVGTELATSKDAPALGGVYKLAEVKEDGQTHHRAKLSEEKITYPGKKQVFRFSSTSGDYEYDVIARDIEKQPGGEPLLTCVMGKGRRAGPKEDLKEVQQRAGEQLRRVPHACRRLREPAKFPVRFSEPLKELLEEVREDVLRTASGRTRVQK